MEHNCFPGKRVGIPACFTHLLVEKQVLILALYTTCFEKKQVPILALYTCFVKKQVRCKKMLYNNFHTHFPEKQVEIPA